MPRNKFKVNFELILIVCVFLMVAILNVKLFMHLDRKDGIRYHAKDQPLIDEQ